MEEEYAVHACGGRKIGKVYDLFLGENDRPEYIGTKMSFFRLSSTLVPMDAVRADEGQRAPYVQAGKDRVKDGPRFDDGRITPDYERRVREYHRRPSAVGNSSVMNGDVKRSNLRGSDVVRITEGRSVDGDEVNVRRR